MTGEQQKQLNAAVCGAFNDRSFAEWLGEFGADVRTSVGEGALRFRVAALVEYFAHRGEIEILLRSLRRVRPNNPAVKDYLSQHAGHLAVTIDAPKDSGPEPPPVQSRALEGSAVGQELGRSPAVQPAAHNPPEQAALQERAQTQTGVRNSLAATYAGVVERTRVLATKVQHARSWARANPRVAVALGLLTLVVVSQALIALWPLFRLIRPSPPSYGTVVVERVSDGLKDRAKTCRLILDGPSGERVAWERVVKLPFDESAEERFLTPGTYKVSVLGADDLVAVPPTVEVVSGQKTSVRIEQSREYDPDRVAAEYVTSIGGEIEVAVMSLPGLGVGSAITITKKTNELPADKFRVTGINLSSNLRCTDESLVKCRGCSHLSRLTLAGTQIGDQALEHFRECRRLRVLNLAFTRVTDAGLAHFKGCVQLNTVNLDKTNVTDVTLANLASSSGIQTLTLMDTQVTQGGLATLKDFKKLETLVLDETSLDDKGLDLLTALKSLKLVSLQRTAVSEEGARMLHAALPSSTIQWDKGVLEPKTKQN